MKHWRKSLIGAAAMMIASGAGASVSDTWKFSTHYTGSDVDGDGYYLGIDNDQRVRVTGWREGTSTGTLYDETGSLALFSSGLGVNWENSTNTWEHAIDNSGSDEFIALEFEHAVSLQSWRWGGNGGYDSDATVLYKNSTTAGLGDLSAGESFPGIVNNTASGYSLLNNFLDPGTSNVDVTPYRTSTSAGGGLVAVTNTGPGSGDNPFTAQDDPVFSRVWLIGAYMKNVPGNSDAYAGAKDKGKLKFVSALKHPGTPPGDNGVPSPAPLLLLATGLLPVLRRRASTSR